MVYRCTVSGKISQVGNASDSSFQQLEGRSRNSQRQLIWSPCPGSHGGRMSPASSVQPSCAQAAGGARPLGADPDA